MKSIILISALAGLIQAVTAQQSLWGQCGGIGWTGPTTCVSGSCCSAQNPYYSQCIQGNCGGGNPTTTTRQVTTTSPGGPSTTTGSNNGGQLSSGCGKAAGITSGTRTINVNGVNRQYIIRVPNNYNPNNGYKLIFTIHWRGGTMTDVSTGQTVQRDVWAYYGLQRQAGESAIFISPQGFGNGWANNNGEDITFIDAIITQVESALCVNQRQRFATGFSWGGGMSYSIACSRATKFRAVAVMSGAQISGCSGGNDPIAYLGIHGIRDNVLGISQGRGLRDRFVRNNGCSASSPAEPSQGSLRHIKTTYNCRSGFPVTWIAFDGGHTPAPLDGQTADSGQSWTAPETWSFFNQFT